jgi:hypothetical protein
MQKSLMRGLNEKDMAAVVRNYNLNDFYYPRLFPLKQTNKLTWKMLEAIAGLHIAADVVSRGSTIPRKTREAISRIEGNIPKIAVSREMLEDELTEYDIAVAMASTDADLQNLVEFWANDTQFVWTGIASRTEWIALKQISCGKVSFTTSNNAAVVTKQDVDYQMGSNQKVGVNTSYASGTSGKPFSKDIPNVLKYGKDTWGANYKVAFCTPETFELLAAQEETIKRCASVLANVINVNDTPTVANVNDYMNRKPELFKGLKFVLIDQDITIELADGSRPSESSGNPFTQNVILFSESEVLGNTFWKTPIDAKKMAGSVAEKVMHGHTLIKKYSEESPVKEVTEGIANLFPAWNLAGRSMLMQVNNTSWNIN